MGKVSCLQLAGLDCWFNSSDHLPPHYHVGKRGEWEIRIYVRTTTASDLDYDVKWGKAPAARVLREIRDLTVEKRVELLEEWEKKVCQE